MTYRLILIMLLCTGLSACNWVDSKGNQNGASNQQRTIVDGGQLLLLEGIPSTAVFSGNSSNLSNWQWQLTGTNFNSDCSANNGFDNDLTAASLGQACTNFNDCNINIEEHSIDGATQFSISTPSLKAPIALHYQVATSDEQGNVVSLDQTLCLVSINEAPFAEDDEYKVLQNLTREIRANEPGNLLWNDSDDIDVRNQALRINPTPIKAPKHADEFILGTDGSFVYRPTTLLTTTPNQDDSEIQDEFVYQLTDGLHTSQATVKLNIVKSNRAPIRVQRTALVAVSVEEHRALGFSVDLATHFDDPDDDPLLFNITEGSLPASGHITLNSDGLLVGNPQPIDVGDYIVTVLASDGIGKAADTFILSIAQFSEQNSAPTVDDISNRTVSDEFSYDVAGFFEDEDDDVLQFSASGLPSGVSITPAGLISGTASSSNRGAWIVVVTADDGRNGRTSDSFRLRIR